MGCEKDRRADHRRVVSRRRLVPARAAFASLALIVAGTHRSLKESVSAIVQHIVLPQLPSEGLTCRLLANQRTNGDALLILQNGLYVSTF